LRHKGKERDLGSMILGPKGQSFLQDFGFMIPGEEAQRERARLGEHDLRHKVFFAGLEARDPGSKVTMGQRCKGEKETGIQDFKQP